MQRHGDSPNHLSAKLSRHHLLSGHELCGFPPDPFYPSLNAAAPVPSGKASVYSASLVRLGVNKTVEAMVSRRQRRRTDVHSDYIRASDRTIENRGI